MGVFHVFLIVQMVPNRVKHPLCTGGNCNFQTNLHGECAKSTTEIRKIKQNSLGMTLFHQHFTHYLSLICILKGFIHNEVQMSFSWNMKWHYGFNLAVIIARKAKIIISGDCSQKNFKWSLKKQSNKKFFKIYILGVQFSK